MRIIFNLVSAAIIFSVIFLASLNFQKAFSFTFWGTNTFNLTLGYLMLIILVAGIFSGVFWAGSFYLPHQKKLKEYKKKLEKTSVDSDSSESQVAVLEAKIEVLEKALKSALEKE